MRLFVILFAVIALVGCRRQPPAQAASVAAPPVSIAIVPVEEQSFSVTVAVTGTLISLTRVDVKAETVGRVVRFPKEEGEPVRAGETVVWVDDENYRLNLRQAESSVQVSEASLEKARVLESHAASELERARNLVVSGGITDKDLKSAQVSEKDAHAQVSLAAAQLEQARAALAVTRKHLTDAIIKAPVNGEIQKKFVNVGAYVEAPTPVFTLVDNNRLELESNVPAAEIAAVRPGQRVSFTTSSHPGVTFEGRVVDVSPAMDAESRAAKVRVQVQSGGKLKTGMFAEGEILTGVQAKAIVVPAAAIYRDDRSAKDSFVYVSANGKAARRNIHIGREHDAVVQIASGLQPGDLLIAEQSIELGEGVPVKARR